jgi:hypothetical protein
MTIFAHCAHLLYIYGFKSQGLVFVFIKKLFYVYARSCLVVTKMILIFPDLVVKFVLCLFCIMSSYLMILYFVGFKIQVCTAFEVPLC